MAILPRNPGEPAWHEANTQAEFYHFARLHGLPVLLELNTPAGRLDLAVLRSDRGGIVAIVECKRDGKTIGQRKIARYKTLGVPVYGLTSFDRVENLVATIARKHASDTGKTWAEIAATIPLPRRTFYRSQKAA